MMTFEQCITAAKALYIMTPITDPVALEAVHSRYENSGLTMMPLDNVKELGCRGMMQCTCGLFLHYTGCHHVVDDAMRKKIIVRIKATMSKRKIEPPMSAVA